MSNRTTRVTGWRLWLAPVVSLSVGALATALLPRGWLWLVVAAVAGLIVGVLVDARAYARAAAKAEAGGFTCPRCNATSHNPNDKAEGYCGRCHTWTDPTAPRYPYRGEL